ncbi:EstA family serine hydrolase [Amycolatopsis sp. NBRC 101858]|uniref:serine hydrolase domain-containing protein n=1 Tax=Amycolatopsis sp. NBRC 101858 TaxID=3032200 RepID=UPI0024A38979|nr:serine hydrolase domain-containing protein [Amycolatopsis sp. NBRC 101858]GLY43339.1 EstA family serine hydrolase [Amycolatopsis sp. NBRC 101858]
MTEPHGTHDPRFAPVHDALRRNLASGAELGASLVVDIDGEVVLDLWGGFRDEARTTPWDRDTITTVWSTTKTVVSLAALMLVDRGELDVHAPVARYWPEFAANGKEHVEVRHLLSHTSGVSGLEQPAALEDLYDWDKTTARLAAQAPWWAPGTASGYHATNFGHLAGEVIRRVSGKTVKDFVAEEIAGPLDADFRIGAAEADWPRIAHIVPPPPAQFDPEPGSVMARTLAGPAVDAALANTAAWRHADIGAVNGHGNARSVARMLSALALGGTVGGVRLLGPDTIDLVFAEQADGTDLGLGIPLRWGIGYALPRPDALPWVPDGKVCFWGGWGGSVIITNLDRRLTIAYVMNKMAPGIIGSDRSTTYVDAIYRALR